MSWKQRLAWPIHRLRETMGLYKYTREQEYRVKYFVTFKENVQIASPRNITFAIPLPPTTPTQTIQDLRVPLPHAQEKRGALYGNSFLIAEINTQEEEVTAFECRIKVKPSQKNINQPPKLGSLDSHQGNDRNTKSKMKYPSDINPFLHPTDARIQTLAKHIGPGSCSTDTARRINDYILDHVAYGEPIDGLYRDVDALERPCVDCGGFDALFVSLCLAQNIRARIVSGFWLDRNNNEMHAWAEFQDEHGRWIPVDPSVEQLARQGRTKKSGRFGYVGSDRIILSYGCHIPIEDENQTTYYAPILQHPFLLKKNAPVNMRGKIEMSTL